LQLRQNKYRFLYCLNSFHTQIIAEKTFRKKH
jgi:hypothetical protein